MVEIGASTAEFTATTLWRYITLDKLIWLLDKQCLYFAPLSAFAQQDPFEGYYPKVAVKATAEIIKEQFDLLENQFAAMSDTRTIPDNVLNTIKNQIASNKIEIKEKTVQIIKRVCVNCWHINDVESEAMWKVYSPLGNGVAIQTTIDSLAASFSTIDETVIHIGVVKYLDFFNEQLAPKDCMVDGHISPLLKRISYDYEKELRAFIVPKFDPNISHNQEPVPYIIPVNIPVLIKKVIISPLASEHFCESIYAVCKKYGINESVIMKSNLLTGHDELINILDDI